MEASLQPLLSRYKELLQASQDIYLTVKKRDVRDFDELEKLMRQKESLLHEIAHTAPVSLEKLRKTPAQKEIVAVLEEILRLNKMILEEAAQYQQTLATTMMQLQAARRVMEGPSVARTLTRVV